MSALGILTIIKAHGGQPYWDDSESYRCADGAQSLVAKLLSTLPEGKLHLKAAAEAIEIGNGIVRVKGGGREFECDDVVLTVPPSAWKRIKLSPALPATLQPQMGRAVKHLHSLSERVWQASGKPADSMGNDVLGMTWEATEGKPDKPFVLASFVGGDPVADLVAMTPAARRELLLREYERLFPGYSKARLADKFVNWVSDPWTGGGYSVPGLGEVTTVWKMLGQPHAERLHFAGEHAAMGFSGFMEGGLQTGVAVANRLARRDGLIKA